MEVMHERNAHNFPLDLASIEAPHLNVYSKLENFHKDSSLGLGIRLEVGSKHTHEGPRKNKPLHA